MDYVIKTTRSGGWCSGSPGYWPTILEALGIKKPTTWEGVKIPRAPGHSLIPAFKEDVVIERKGLWWLHDGNKAMRVGNYKLVAAKGDPWALYDLETDRAEAHNLAEKKPKRVNRLEALWNRMTEEMEQMRPKKKPKNRRKPKKKK